MKFENREYTYNWKVLWQVLLVIPFIGVYAVWKQADFNKADCIIMAIAVLLLAGKQALPLSRVLLIDSEIHISFLIPVRRGGRFRYDEIEYYTELRMPKKTKKVLLGGFLQPKGKKHIMFLASGIKDFAELNSMLSELFPKQINEEE